MFDFAQYAKTQFYSGVPDKITPDKLVWDRPDYTLTVQETAGMIVATMTGGESDWMTIIDPERFVEMVNAALKDASDLRNYPLGPSKGCGDSSA